MSSPSRRSIFGARWLVQCHVSCELACQHTHEPEVRCVSWKGNVSAMNMNCLAKYGHEHANYNKSRADWNPIAAGKLADWKPSRFNFTSRIPNCYLQVFTCTCNLDSLSREFLGNVHWASIKHLKASEPVYIVSWYNSRNDTWCENWKGPCQKA